MKNLLFGFLVLVMLVGCSKDDKPTFNYDLNVLVGTWRITYIGQSDGSYLDVSSSLAEEYFEPTYAIFNSDGSYSGSGAFGTGSGTYKAIENTITTYIEGEEYMKYDVLSLSGNDCELKMYQTDSESIIKIKCKKQ